MNTRTIAIVALIIGVIVLLLLLLERETPGARRSVRRAIGPGAANRVLVAGAVGDFQTRLADISTAPAHGWHPQDPPRGS